MVIARTAHTIIATIIMALIVYTLTQSLMYLSLAGLPSATLSLILNLTSVFTALAGVSLLKERPSALQWAGLGLAALGVGVYFLPVNIPKEQLIGLLFGIACMAANVVAALLGMTVIL